MADLASRESGYPDRLELPFVFDPGAMAADLHRLSSDEWIAHFVKQNYSGDWSVIPLRGPVGARHPVQMIYSDPSCRNFEDTPLLDRCPCFREVLDTFACALQSVRLMRLSPGSLIKEHRDHDLGWESGTARIHIPVTTNDGVEFYLNGSRVVMPAGSSWYLRLSDPHRVANNGETDRVHMVIDAEVGPWLQDVFAAALERQRASSEPAAVPA